MRFWRAFTWFNVIALIGSVILRIAGEAEFALLDLPDYAFSLVSLVVLYCFSYRKKILNPLVWKIFLLVMVAWNIGRLVFDKESLGSGFTEILATVAVYGVAPLLIYIPVFLYSLNSNTVWNDDISQKKKKDGSKVFVSWFRTTRRDIATASVALFLLIGVLYLGDRIYAAWIIYHAVERFHSKNEQLSGTMAMVPPLTSVSGTQTDLGFATFTSSMGEWKKIRLETFTGNDQVLFFTSAEFTLFIHYPDKCDPDKIAAFYNGNPLNEIKRDLETEDRIINLIAQNGVSQFKKNAKCSYQLSKWAVSRTPRRPVDLFFMDADHWESYLSIHLIGLGKFGTNTERIESAQINALTGKGFASSVGARVWSQNGKMAFSILATEKEPGVGQKIVREILSSLHFSFEELPEKTELEKLIRATIESNPVFVSE